MAKTTFTDSLKPECEKRDHTTSGTYSAMGRSYYYITCPFCGAREKAFIWSINGGGKRCSCGALHSARGITYKMPPKPKKGAV